jgi:hypothetical protein
LYYQIYTDQIGYFMSLHEKNTLRPLSKEASSRLLARLKKVKPQKLDEAARRFHEEAFEHMECLSCANCCKTTRPVFYQRDIEY